MSKCGSDRFPSMHHRKEGGCVINKISRSHRKRRSRGGFPLVLNRKTTPASRSVEASQYFLIARPSLLAVMQGGESASPKLLNILSQPLTRAYGSHQAKTLWHYPFRDPFSPKTLWH